MSKQQQRQYVAPKFTIHGSLRGITKGGNVNVTDAPIGDNSNDPGEFPGS